MAISRKTEPGECIRCGTYYQSDIEKRKYLEFCTECMSKIEVYEANKWREKGESNADYPKK